MWLVLDEASCGHFSASDIYDNNSSFCQLKYLNDTIVLTGFF